MSALRIVLDTGVFYYPEALTRLAELPHDIIVPVVALAERLRQVERDGLDGGAFRRALRRAQVDVEPMREDHATRFAPTLTEDVDWRRLSHDAFIAGHVGDDDELWTTNPEDFVRIGLRAAQIVAVG